MKRSCILIMVVALLLSACHKKDDSAIGPTSFALTMDTIRATKVKTHVYSSNNAAYYYADIKHDSIISKLQTDKAIIDDLLEELDMSYTFLLALLKEFGVEDEPDYNDVFLYKGSRQITMSYLAPDTDYHLLVFQMNPKTHQPIGELQRVPLHTAAIDSVDVTFEVSFAGDTLIITPSDNEVAYLWDYEMTSEINENFLSEEAYIVETVGMYEDYGFVEAMTHKGEKRVVIYNPGYDASDWVDYTLFVVGYNGEMNSEPTIVHFVYDNGEMSIVESQQTDMDEETLVHASLSRDIRGYIPLLRRVCRFS